MVVADMTAWYAEHPDNVVVVHCKAGKGRSGTLACCYLISLPKLPPPPQDPRNLSETQRAAKSKRNAESSEVADGSGEDDSTASAAERQGQVDNQASSSVSRPTSPRRPFTLVLKARRSLSALRSRNVSSTPEAPSIPQQPSLSHLRCSSANKTDQRINDSPAPSPSKRAQIKESLLPSTTGQEMMALEDKLEAVFELHTARRLKPEKTSKGVAKTSSRGSLTSNRRSRGSTETERPNRGQSDSQSRQAAASTPCLLLPASEQNGQTSIRSSEGVEADGVWSEFERQPRLSFAIPPSPSLRSRANSTALQPTEKPSVTSHRTSPYLSPPRDPRPSSLHSSSSRNASRAALGINPMGKSSEYLNSRTMHSPSAAPSVTISPSESMGRVSKSSNSSRRPSTDLAGWGRKSIDRLMTPLASSDLVRHRSSSAATSRSQLEYNDADADAQTAYDRSRDDLRGRGDDNASVTKASSDAKRKRLGVSIASQRRWVGYWARVLRAEDPRSTLDYITPSKPTRLIKVTRISLLQNGHFAASNPEKRSLKSVTKVNTYHLTIGKYQDALVEKIEGWERGARRRARAFGMIDPGARAPELICSPTAVEDAHRKQEGYLTDLCSPPSCVPGEDRWEDKYGSRDGQESSERQDLDVKVKSRSRRPSSADWRQCASFNSADSAKRRLAQNGNDTGVGEWGVNVVSEAERCRHFNWPDGRNKDDDDSHRSKDHKPYHFIRWGPKFKDSTTEQDSPTEDGEGIWHHFDLSGTISAVAHARRGAEPNAVMHDNKLRATASPPTPRRSSDGEHIGVAGGGLLLSPDREVCVKVHLANKAFSLLPDIAGSAGWVWFIPAFEEPCVAVSPNRTGRRGNDVQTKPKPKKGFRTVVEFNRDEIDFVKRIAGVQAIQVEWEWVEVGDEIDEGNEDEDEDEERESLGDHGGVASAPTTRSTSSTSVFSTAEAEVFGTPASEIGDP